NDGQTQYEVATKDDLDLGNNGSVTIDGNKYLSNAGIDANSQVITNVAAGSVAANSKDAVNGGQLYQTNKDVADALGTTLDGNGRLQQPSYTVSQGSGSNATFNNVKDAIENITGANGGTGVGIKYFHANSSKDDSVAEGDDS